MRWWTPQQTELPQKVMGQVAKIANRGAILHPYWWIAVRVNIKAPFLPVITRPWYMVVNANTGEVGVPPPLLPVELPHGGIRPDMKVAPATLKVEDIDHAQLKQATLAVVARRVRSWTNVSLAMGEVQLVHKELRLFDVEFVNGSQAVLALDTLSGEYGLLSRTARIHEDEEEHGDGDASLGEPHVAGDRQT